MTRLHATTVAIDGRGVALIGPSGSGKSDLALRLIDRGATLVSDDYTEFVTSGTALRATAPESIAGKIEVRGLGIRAIAHQSDVSVILVIQLGGAVERMPADATISLAGITLPLVRLDAFAASAAIKVELALRGATEAL